MKPDLSHRFRKQALSLMHLFRGHCGGVRAHPPVASDPAGKQARDHPDRSCFPAPMPWNRRRTIPYTASSQPGLVAGG